MPGSPQQAHAGLTLQRLKALVAAGEGLHLEFKRKAAYPEKIAEEIVAFANTDGGTLLIGVDDNGSIPGVKYPAEESLAVREALRRLVRPQVSFSEEWVTLSEKRVVVAFHVPRGKQRPHTLEAAGGRKETFVRHADMTLKASREMREILRRSRSARGVRFMYGDAENMLMKHLVENPAITLNEFRKLAGLSKFNASRKLVLLVCAHVLQITPSLKGDVYSRV